MVSTIRTEHWAWWAIEFGTLPRTLRAPRMPLLPSGQVGGTNRLRLIGGDDVQLGAASLRSSTGKLGTLVTGDDRVNLVVGPRRIVVVEQQSSCSCSFCEPDSVPTRGVTIRGARRQFLVGVLGVVNEKIAATEQVLNT